MGKSAHIQTRIEPDVKENADAIFKSLGISMSEAMSMFLKQVIHHKGLPFSVRIPNAETIEAMRQVREGETSPVTLAELSKQFNLTQDEGN